NRAEPIALPPAQLNADWTHRGGGPSHQIAHPALGGTLALLFSVDIGAGNGRRVRITADPVIAGGRVFTLDSQAQVQATSTGGAVLWRADLTPPADDPSDGSGGGIATDGATVYVTTGFGRVTALDAATGAVRWVQALEAAGTLGLTVGNGVVPL
ncbi:PQQ-binding-like beta-propeller repeat protein, partial [Aphanothece microscopica]|uniref:outer membrane protein assembly factor BamB family protein n=1 Tax=Aphanothece microscopica TaxID=1049561 RepID=UPI003984A9F4